MSKETFDTLGNQKKVNYALANMTKEAFIKELTTGILPAPQYFAKNAQLNKTGYDNYDTVTSKGTKALSVNDAKHFLETTNAIILDVRKPQEFSTEHIPNSIFIGIDGQFAPWVGALITDLKQAIILVTPKGREEETVMRLSRVGYDNCIGFVDGGLDAWKHAGNTTSSILSITADEFSGKLSNTSIDVLDVRKPGEYESSHLCSVNSNPLDFITDWQDSLSKDKEYHIHCAGGYRSMIAASILKRNGYEKLVDVTGGFGAIQKTNAKIVTTACKTEEAKKEQTKSTFLNHLSHFLRCKGGEHN